MKRKWFKQKSEEDNIVATVKNLLYYLGIPFTNSAIENELNIHKQNPTLQSITDILTLYHIPNKAVKISKEKLLTVNFPAIAYFESEKFFCTIHSINNGEVKYIDTKRGWQTVTLDQFLSNWSGYILMALKVEKSGEINYRENLNNLKLERRNKQINLILISIIFSLFLANTCFWSTNKIIFLNLLKAVGFLTSIILFKIETGTKDSWMSKFCSSNKLFNCEMKISSIFGGKLLKNTSLSRIGIIYFFASILLLNLLIIFHCSDIYLNIQFFISLFTVVFVIILLLIQAFYFKKFCPFCSIIHLILIFELIITRTYNHLLFKLNSDLILVLELGLIFVLISLILLRIHGRVIKKQLDYKLLDYKYKFILSNQNVLSTLLVSQHQINYESFKHDIVIGNMQMSDELLLILSPFCNYCSEVFFETHRISELLDNLKIRLRFIFKNDKNSLDYKLVSIVLNELMKNGVEKAYEFLYHWYSIKNLKTKTKIKWIKDNFENIEDNSTKELLLQHLKFSQECKVDKTPSIFYNGNALPDMVDFNFLRNYLISRSLKTS